MVILAGVGVYYLATQTSPGRKATKAVFGGARRKRRWR